MDTIFGYADFRAFLKDRYTAEKARNPRFSHRFIAQRVGAGSAGWFADIVKGRIRLGAAFLPGLARTFGLGPREEEYFMALVEYDQAETLEARNRHLEKILSFKELKVEQVGREQFEYYGSWYYAAVRELLFIHAFKGDYAALGRKLSPPIGAAQAKKAVALLVKLGFVRKDAEGRYRPLTSIVRKDSAFRSTHLANYLKAHGDLAIEALERHPKAERDISAVTVALGPKEFQKAREEVQALRLKLLALGEKPGTGKRVYQCNFQLFPLSEKE